MTSSDDRALREASQRIREHAGLGWPGKVGRPRKSLPRPELSHKPAVDAQKRRTGSEFSKGAETNAPGPEAPGARGCADDAPGTRPNVGVASLQCRLLSLPDTAAYLGVSEWTVRDLEAAGVLSRVRVPLPNGRELRKLLFDRTDLDRLIETWKAG
jgi:hypothetical protein